MFSLPLTLINDPLLTKLASLIDSNISKYQNLAVTADNVKDAKKIKANLNKLKKALDGKRLEIKKANAQPYLNIEKQIKGIESSINEVVEPIVHAVKELDDQEKEARQIYKCWYLFKLCRHSKDNWLPIKRLSLLCTHTRPGDFTN